MCSTSKGQAVVGLAFLIVSAALAFNARAGTFTVSPVRASLSSDQPVAALVVRNTGAEPTVVQLETVSWTQADGQDVYSPTKEILATPPIFTVQPGASQVVRVGLRRAVDGQRELTYRIFLQEVPPKTDFQGLRVVLRMGVPVFVNPPVKVSPQLHWRAIRTADGLKLSVSNAGSKHVQVARSKVTLARSAQLVSAHDVASYVLPGKTREWTFKPAVVLAAGSTLRVFAQTDAGDVQAELTVE